MIYRPNVTVSCVMPTFRSLNEIMPSIHCYFNQSVHSKDLIVFSKSDIKTSNEIRDYINSLNRTDVQFFEAPHNLSLDGMYNALTDLSKSDILCHWSDTDLSHRNRLQLQLKCLLDDNRRMLCFYCNYLEFRNGQIFWRNCIEQKFPLNQGLLDTLMLHREKFCEFNTIYSNQGYSNNILKLILEGNIGLVSSGYYYIHLTNDSGEFYISEKDIMQNLDLINETLRDANMGQTSVVVDGQIVFTYLPNFDRIG